MDLAAGVRLGPYEIVAPLGAGGMGQVYKARDTRLDRSVAIKILQPPLAHDPQFRERFDREARVISQLEHPHICPLYDVGAHEGVSYLVMQLLDGDTLAARLQRGPLPLSQALEVAIEIADALSAAHRAGIVHRDLKPGNIMLTKAGARLLDFGLATPRPAVMSGTSGATISARLTAEGTIVGTFEYMAPEQIEGGDADERTDSWAFGCVLYEMLAGARPFSGKSAASVIANILGAEPPRLRERQPVTPPSLEHVVHRCLEKDPNLRWQSIVDVAHELRWIATGEESAASAGTSPWKQPRRYAAALTLVLATAALTWFATGQRDEPVSSSGAPRKALLPIPAHLELTAFGSASAPHFALSPDGRRIAYVASTADLPPSVWVQELDSRIARTIAGSEEASAPFWFPDSQTVGFFSNGWLKTIALDDERPVNVVRVLDPAGGTSNGEVILVGRGSSSLLRVPVTGGAASEVYPLKNDEGHRWPQFLADDRHFLYAPRLGGIMLGALDQQTPSEILPQQAGAAFAPPNFLLFFRPDVRKLRAQALHPTTFRPVGAAGDAVEPATYSSGSGYPSLSASADGVLAYWDGTVIDTEPGWFDRAGKKLALPLPEKAYNLALSPRSDRIVFSRRPGEDGVPIIWLFDVNTGATQRLSYTPEGAARGLWVTDDEIRFSSVESTRLTLFSRPTSGTRREREIGRVPLESEIARVGNFYAADWTSDGSIAVVSVTQPTTSRDIMAFDIRTSALRRVIQTEGLDIQPRLSPDNRWIAYASDETGRLEVYVEPFLEPGAKRQISQAGGSQPVWRSDGNELFFLGADRKLMSVAVTTGRTFVYQPPRELFQTSLRSAYAPYPVNYSVNGDGQRFLLESVKPHTRPTISLYINWQSSLRNTTGAKPGAKP